MGATRHYDTLGTLCMRGEGVTECEASKVYGCAGEMDRTSSYFLREWSEGFDTAAATARKRQQAEIINGIWIGDGSPVDVGDSYYQT